MTFIFNRYGMPFAPFIGVNHHGSSILLAAALVKNEDTVSFEWVFEKWLECMGKPPSVILSDQDKAIGNAIKNVFPGIPHRLCLWHMMRNAQKHLGRRNNWKEISEKMRMAVHDSLEEFEFEEAWKGLIDEFGLQNNAWIKEAYEIRKRWAPVYWRGVFCAGMSSTQRSEGQNRFFKAYVSQNTDLLTFVKQVENALHSKAVEEKNMNFDCMNKPPYFDKMLLGMEVYHKVYTNSKYEEVKKQVYGLIHTNAIHIDTVGSYIRYSADEKLERPCFKRWRKEFNVEIDTDKGEFNCECKLFEFTGILCKHILRCIELEEIRFIPQKYILDRWRKDVVREYERIRVGYYDPDHSDRVKKLLDIAIKNDNISKLAMQDDEAFEKYQRAADGLIKDLEEHFGIDVGESFGANNVSTKVWSRRRLQPRENNQRHIMNSTIRNDNDLKDPPNKRGNGRAAKGKGNQVTFKTKRKLDKIRPDNV